MGEPASVGQISLRTARDDAGSGQGIGSWNQWHLIGTDDRTYVGKHLAEMPQQSVSGDVGHGCRSGGAACS